MTRKKNVRGPILNCLYDLMGNSNWEPTNSCKEARVCGAWDFRRKERIWSGLWPLTLRIRKLIIVNNLRRKKPVYLFWKKSILQREDQRIRVCKSRSLCHLVICDIWIGSTGFGLFKNWHYTKSPNKKIVPWWLTVSYWCTYLNGSLQMWVVLSFTWLILLSSVDYLVMP